MTQSCLALLGGPKTFTEDQPEELMKWPQYTQEHEDAVLDVLRRGAMSGLDVTKEFESAYAKKIGRKYGLGMNTGTNAILAGFFALGVGVGDEVIAPSMTYWASLLGVYTLGATPVFAEIDPDTLCIDPDDIEHRITPRTKAIVIVHYAGMPCDMDRILPIAKKHNIPVLEDVSHAHGALYKGKEVGTFTEVAAMSLMSGKSFAVGEAGILFTDDQNIYERAILFGLYSRHGEMELEENKKYAGLPCGGYKNRMHQLSSAVGKVELKYYYAKMEEINRSMLYFCELVEGTPGLKPILPPKGENSNRGGWYFPTMKYIPEELGGLSNQRFAEAVLAEGSHCGAGCNTPLHLHPVFTEMDIYHHGKPTRVANLPEGVTISQPKGSLPVTEGITRRVLALPWFKKYYPQWIEKHAEAYKKVAENYRDLLDGDQAVESTGGYSAFTKIRQQNK